MKQGEAKVEQVVQVGVKLFRELGERAARLEAEVQLYRDAMIKLAVREGVDVPAVVRPESGGSSECGGSKVEELREWLERVDVLLSGPGPFAVEEVSSAGRGRGRSGGARKRGRVEGRGVSIRERGKRRNVVDEDE